MVVGGSHFYIRALLLGLFPTPPPDPEGRRRLAEAWQTDPARCFARLQAVDPTAAARVGPNDRQRILRALEIHESSGETATARAAATPQRLHYRPLLLAPGRAREDLYARINLRVDSMFASGLVREVEEILAAGVDPRAHSLKAIGYREVVQHLQGACSLADATAAVKTSSRRLAKRQLSWLRTLREGALRWVPPAERGGVEVALREWTEFKSGSEAS